MRTVKKKLYAIIFKHPRGWTYVDACETAAKARIYCHNHRSVFDQYQWKIVPGNMILNLPDKIAENFK